MADGRNVTRRYPARLNAVLAERPLWVSQHAAADELGVGLLRVGFLVSKGRLIAAETAAREMGVTRESLDGELRWRRTSTRWQRLRRTLGYVSP
jgi:hypothetical protein